MGSPIGRACGSGGRGSPRMLIGWECGWGGAGSPSFGWVSNAEIVWVETPMAMRIGRRIARAV
jgi:hypothetical protein